jgi:hypothetical protein
VSRGTIPIPIEETGPVPKLCVPHCKVDLTRSYYLIMELEKDNGIFGCQRLAAYKASPRHVKHYLLDCIDSPSITDTFLWDVGN